MPRSRETVAAYRITDLEVTERPRERLQHQGASSLSKAELLAILLRVGTVGENAVQVAQRLLDAFGNLRGIQQASFQDVCRQKGVGEAKAAQIKAAIELGSRLLKEDAGLRESFNSPDVVAEYVRYEMSALDHEELWVLVLDTRNRLLATEKLYRGSLNSSPVRVGEIFRAAIMRNAANILVVHNHPSGDPTPSPEDIALTRAIQSAGKLMDIELLDHLVIGHGKWVSLKQRGLGFSG